MATRQELEAMTASQLRQVAAEQNVDVSGLTAKADLVNAIDAAQGGTGEAAPAPSPPASTQPTTQEGTTVSDTSTESSASTSASAPEEPEEREALVLSEPLGIREPAEEEQELGDRFGSERPFGPEEQQKAGVSPADLELSIPPGEVGAKILVKSNPETPSPQQVDSAVSIVGGPPVTTVTIKSGDEETVQSLAPDDAALISQRAAAAGTHPAHASAGHYANPTFKEPTDEEREADQEAYASRFG